MSDSIDDIERLRNEAADALSEGANMGLPSDLMRVGYVPVALDAQGAVLDCPEPFTVRNVRGGEAKLTLPPIRALCIGSAPAPDLSGAPADIYTPMIVMLERTAGRYFEATKRPEYDEELLRIFSQLARRPDGRDTHKLTGYLQAAARASLVYMSLSEAEVEAIFRRLSHSAKRFRKHTTSTNYWTEVLSRVDALL